MMSSFLLLLSNGVPTTDPKAEKWEKLSELESGKTYLLGPMMSLNQACDTGHANPPLFVVPAWAVQGPERFGGYQRSEGFRALD